MSGSRLAGLRAAMLASLVLLCGCAGSGAPTASDTFCGVVEEPVCITSGDRLVEATASRIEGINLAHRRLCQTRVPCRDKAAKPAPAATEPRSADS